MRVITKVAFSLSVISIVSISAFSAHAENCSIFKSVYKPSDFKRKDGITYSLTIVPGSDDDKIGNPANFELNTFDPSGKMLARLTLDYQCSTAGGHCSLGPDRDGKVHTSPLDPVGLTKDFKVISGLQDGKEVPHAWVLSGLDVKLQYFDWQHAEKPEEVFGTLPSDSPIHISTPLVWVFSKCTE